MVGGRSDKPGKHRAPAPGKKGATPPTPAATPPRAPAPLTPATPREPAAAPRPQPVVRPPETPVVRPPAAAAPPPAPAAPPPPRPPAAAPAPPPPAPPLAAAPELSQLPPPRPPATTAQRSSSVDPEFILDPVLRRKRLTVLVRPLLAIPLLVVGFFYSIAFGVALFISWFAALFIGRLPHGLASFLDGFLRFQTRVTGYLYLLTDKYPPFGFSAGDYPINTVTTRSRLNRGAVLFRYFLGIPVMLLRGLLTAALVLLGPVSWLCGVVGGRTPKSVYQAIAMINRYEFRLNAYVTMLTPTYPGGPFGDSRSQVEEAVRRAGAGAPAARANVFLRTKATVAWLTIGIIVGLAADVGSDLAVRSHIHLHLRQSSDNQAVAAQVRVYELSRQDFIGALTRCSGTEHMSACLAGDADGLAQSLSQLDDAVRQHGSASAQQQTIENLCESYIQQLHTVGTTLNYRAMVNSLQQINTIDKSLGEALIHF